MYKSHKKRIKNPLKLEYMTKMDKIDTSWLTRKNYTHIIATKLSEGRKQIER